MKNDEIKNDSEKNLNDKENIKNIKLKKLELTSDDQNETLLISRFEDKYIITLGNESIDIFNDDTEINKKIRELTENKKLQSEILEKIGK